MPEKSKPNGPVKKEIKEILRNKPKVEEVEVTLKYEKEELKDVNGHKWKGVM
jgi:hypothetical protein